MTQPEQKPPRKAGPKTIYDREETLTIRVSPLFKRIIAAAAERHDVSAGDFLEHLGRTRAAQVRPEEFKPDLSSSSAT